MSRQHNDKKLPAIGTIFIDNYEELGSGRDSEVIAEATRCIRDYMREFDGVLRRYEMGRYSFIIEQSNLERIFKTHFSLLDRVREIQTSSGLPVTLSIGVGIGPTLPEASAYSFQALELAFGRGGDQAVVKRQDRYEFHGGKRQPGERYSRVKSRVFARALKQLMQQYTSILVMGHKMADYDALGSAMGLFSCAHSLDITDNVFLVLDHANDMVDGILTSALVTPLFDNRIIGPEEAIHRCDAKTLLIITDTQRPSSIPAPELLELAGATAVIDHHRRGVNTIEATLQYVQVSASSTSELVCEIIEYFSNDVKLHSIVSSALLAGITVDTKHFSVNTGARTFEAAAFLRRQGADPSIVKALFQDDLDTYLARADVVGQGRFIFPSIVVSVCRPMLRNALLIAAQAADELTGIRNVQAAFVLTEIPEHNTINISARSIGEVNVQVILESLGGGGHLNVAGAQLTNTTLAEVEERLTAAIHQYLCAEAPDLLGKHAEKVCSSMIDSAAQQRLEL